MEIEVVGPLTIMCNEQLHNCNSAIYQHSVIVMLPSCIVYLDSHCHCEVGVCGVCRFMLIEQAPGNKMHFQRFI